MAHTEHDGPDAPTGAGVGYEPTDAAPSPVLTSAFFLLVALILGFVGAAFFLSSFEELELAARPAPSPFLEDRSVPAGPLLQAQPGAELQAYLEEQRGFLESYGWVDEDAGIAHVPVQLALDAVAESGELPDWAPAEASP